MFLRVQSLTVRGGLLMAAASTDNEDFNPQADIWESQALGIAVQVRRRLLLSCRHKGIVSKEGTATVGPSRVRQDASASRDTTS